VPGNDNSNRLTSSPFRRRNLVLTTRLHCTSKLLAPWGSFQLVKTASLLALATRGSALHPAVATPHNCGLATSASAHLRAQASPPGNLARYARNQAGGMWPELSGVTLLKDAVGAAHTSGLLKLKLA
jgi:hypothetical protein